jgi:predicted phage terminase large subunit-like protein
MERLERLEQLIESNPDEVRAICLASFITYFKVMFLLINRSQAMVKPFHKEVAAKLQDIVNGDNDKRNLALCLPVGSGKSLIIQYFISWCFARSVNNAFVYISHSRDNISKMSRETRDICMSEPWVVLFGGEIKGDQKSIWNWAFKDAIKRTGLMAKPLGSGVTGLDAGNPAVSGFSGAMIIDDPMDAGNSRSQVVKTKVYRFYDEKLTPRRRMPNTPTILISQRLAVDDLVGWIKENELDNWDIVEIPALDDGESFWPERYPMQELLEIKAQNPYKFQAQYQQAPILDGGQMFKVDGFTVSETVPSSVVEVVRYWDKAGTAGGGAYTAGVKMAKLKDGRFIVLDVRRGQLSALEREQMIKSCANHDGKECNIWIEQEPGSGGKESAESTIRNLAGYNCRAERATGDKVTRAEPYAAQVEAGNIILLRGEWNAAFITEHQYFPDGQYKDQVDAAAGAFNKLAVFIEPPKVAQPSRMAFAPNAFMG